MDSQQLESLITFDLRKRALEKELQELKDQRAALEAALLDQFAAEGIQKVTVKSGTVYLHGQLWAHPIDGQFDRACDALEKAGLGDFVQRRFNINSLSAYFRDLKKEEKPVPESIAGAIDVSERFSLKTRKE